MKRFLEMAEARTGWKSIGAGLVLVWLLGCQPAPRRAVSITPLTSPPAGSAPSLAAQAPERPAPAPPGAPPVASGPLWLALASWCREHGLAAPTVGQRGAELAYTLAAPRGTLVLVINHRQAWWQGMALWLAYAPVLDAGQPMVQALDAAKVLTPLLLGPTRLAPANRLLVLDPGHGGRNTGTRSILDGRWEKEFTLDWALRLRPLLVAEGWQVVLTRTNDTDVSLAQRVAFANQRHPGLFVSLHFNSAGAHPEADGMETYCLTPVGMPSSLVRDAKDDLTLVFPNNAFDGANLLWAVRLHRALVRQTAEPDRGVRHARFMGVLRGQACPAVLVEGGYLSNPAEARLIGSGGFRQKLAAALADALRVDAVVAER